MANSHFGRLMISLVGLWSLQSDHLLGTRLAAQGDLNVWQREIVQQSEDSTMLRSYLANGFVLQEKSALLGYLGQDRRQDKIITFETGYQHVVIGKCDSDCSDVDFALYDPNGRLVAEDTLADDTPLIKFIPRVRGNYTLRVSMPGCSAPIGCHWGAIVASSR